MADRANTPTVRAGIKAAEKVRTLEKQLVSLRRDRDQLIVAMADEGVRPSAIAKHVDMSIAAVRLAIKSEQIAREARRG
jgi:hypothetical protein